MKKNLLCVPVCLMLTNIPVMVNAAIDAQRYLLDQVAFGEKRNNFTLVRQSLDKLDLINANHPQVVVAWINYAIKTHNQTLATQKFNLLKKTAPNTPEFVQARILMVSNTPSFQRDLLQARRLAGQNKLLKASQIYRRLFADNPPADIALEYWSILAYNSATRPQAITALRHIAGGEKIIEKLQGKPAAAPMTVQTSPLKPSPQQIQYNQLLQRGYVAVKQQQWDSARQYFSQALKLNTASREAQQGLLQVQQQQQQQQLSQLKDQAKQLKLRGDLTPLIEVQQQIVRLQPAEIWNSYDLAMSYAQKGELDQANQVFSEYFRHNPQIRRDQSRRYVYALYLHATGQTDQAWQQLKNIPDSQRTAQIQQLYHDVATSIELRDLDLQAKQLTRQGQIQALISVQQRIVSLQPENVWAVFNLASSYARLNQTEQGDQLFFNSALARNQQYAYAHGLYLFETQREQQALQALEQIKPEQQDSQIKNLITQIHIEQDYQEAQRRWAAGHMDQAIALVQAQPESSRKHLLLADWYLSLQDWKRAEQYYAAVLDAEPESVDGRLGLASVYLHTRPEQAKQLAIGLYQHLPEPFAEKRKLANLLADLNLTAQADVVYRELDQLQFSDPSPDAALLKNDLAKWHHAENRPHQALSEWQQAMYLAGLSRTIPENTADFTRTTRLQLADNWLARDIRQSAAQAYRQQDTTISSGLNYAYYKGDAGTSHVSQPTLFLQAQFALGDGRAFLQASDTDLNAGSLSSNSPHWASCSMATCTDIPRQQQQIQSMAFGWKNTQWEVDLGSISTQQKNFDILGGISYSNHVLGLNYQLTAERRRLSNSLLSYYGQTDPLTGTEWGGTHVDQLGIQSSYGWDAQQGWWSNIDVGRLRGHHVANNTRLRSNLGYYRVVLNQDHQKLTTGLDGSFLHYDKNLSAYTLGQGGYYSPQRYYSIGIPVDWQKSTSQWSWGVKARISYAYAQTEDGARYPLKNLVSAYKLSDVDATEKGRTSQGLGYSLKAFAERRISPHWFIGTAVNVQYQKDYVPSNVMMYIKYSVGGWQGDMDLPVQIPTLYVDR